MSAEIRDEIPEQITGGQGEAPARPRDCVDSDITHTTGDLCFDSHPDGV